MGKGKGSVDFWCALVPEGRVLFQLSGVPKNAAKAALSLGSFKLPIPTKFTHSF
jgi:large subunit ribosomal protein L16